MTKPPTPSNQEGPTQPPPSLPEGWLAQWEGQSRKYYYVQRATGHSQWDIPTQAALSVPTPDPTPQPTTDPFGKPADGAPEGSRGVDEGAERGFLSDLATNVVSGKQHKPHKQSGLEGIASSFLGSGQHGSHGGGGHGGGSGGAGGLAGQLVGSLLGGGKPNKHSTSSGQPQGASVGVHGSSAPPPAVGGGHHGPSGLMGMASGFMGGHHAGGQNTNYGYSSGHGSGGSGYIGEAPPATYNPSGQTPFPPTSQNEYRPPSHLGDQTSHSYGGPAPYGKPPQNQHGNEPLNIQGQYGQSVHQQSGGYGQPPSYPGPPPLPHQGGPPPGNPYGSHSSTPAHPGEGPPPPHQTHQQPSYQQQQQQPPLQQQPYPSYQQHQDSGPPTYGQYPGPGPGPGQYAPQGNQTGYPAHHAELDSQPPGGLPPHHQAGYKPYGDPNEGGYPGRPMFAGPPGAEGGGAQGYGHQGGAGRGGGGMTGFPGQGYGPPPSSGGAPAPGWRA